MSANCSDLQTKISTNGQKQGQGKYYFYFPKTDDTSGSAMTIKANNGSISTGNLLSYSDSDSGNAGTGGAIAYANAS